MIFAIMFLFMIICAIVFIVLAGRCYNEEHVTELTTEEAIEQLQSIKPYFEYKGKVWVALDMAIKEMGGNKDGDRGQ